MTTKTEDDSRIARYGNLVIYERSGVLVAGIAKVYFGKRRSLVVKSVS